MGEYTYPIIRNEKVGCSIHLSGTKQKALIRKSQGFFIGDGRERRCNRIASALGT